MRLAIYGSRSQNEHLEMIRRLMDELKLSGIEVVMHEKLYKYLLRPMPLALGSVVRVCNDNEPFVTDCAMSLGGDGTFLKTAIWVGEKNIPIIGVNTGHLGYLTAVSLEEFVDRGPGYFFAPGELVVEPRTLLQVVEPAMSMWPCALNEVAVLKDESTSMIDVEVKVNGEFLGTYRSDGLIVSTPTGSTAYNLSAGGPIMAPRTPAIALSPIAAHTLSQRPLVIPDDVELEVKVSSRSHSYRLCLDGRSITLALHDKVRIRKAPYVISLLRTSTHGFANTLRTKLGWGAAQI